MISALLESEYVKPPRFEDEYPEEAQILMDECQSRGRRKSLGKRLVPWDLDGTALVQIDIGKVLGRNAPCVCGSGKKFKKCCSL